MSEYTHRILNQNEQDENNDSDEAEGQANETDFIYEKRHLFANKHQKRQETNYLWLITFTDVMALMLTFFVLLYSMAVPDEEKWNEMTEGLDTGFSVQESAPDFSAGLDEISIDKLDMSSGLSLSYLEAIVKKIIANNSQLDDVILIRQKKQLTLSLPSNLLFENGQDTVTTAGKRALFSLGGQLTHIKNRIEIVGHSDPSPIDAQSDKFSSNWDLSLSRALNVAATLENVGYSSPIVVRGLSSSRYEELPDTIDENERLALSRRVDLVIMSDDGKQRSSFDLGF